MHTTLLKSNIVLTASELVRQVPTFLKSHHSGIVADCEIRSRNISLPETCGRSWGRTNETTSTFVPAFVSHANERLLVLEPSPWQDDHARFIPGAARPGEAT